jgi:hypothetical protein
VTVRPVAALMLVACGCDRPLSLGTLAPGALEPPGDLAAAPPAVDAAATDDVAVPPPSWSAVASPTSHNLRGLWVEGGTGFAVGEHGTILRLEGGAWSQIPSGLVNQLYDMNAVWGMGGVAWAVGGYLGIARAVGWDGSSWSDNSFNVGRSLNAVWGASASDLWAVGDSGTTLHVSGGGWSPAAIPSLTDLIGLGGAPGDAGSMRAVASDGIYAWDGSSWRSAMGSAPSSLSGGISVAGDTWVTASSGSLYRASAGAWSEPVPTNLASALHGLWRAPGGGDLFAVGAAGVVVQGDGVGPWSITTVAGADLYAVAGDSATDVWAVGDGGTIVHYH